MNLNFCLFQSDLVDKNQQEEEVFCGDLSASRKRSKKQNKDKWKYESQKKKRMRGEDYAGFKTDAADNKRKLINIRNAKALGPTCSSKTCEASGVRHCSVFSEEARQQLFEYFWTQLNWEQKKLYVLSLVDQIPKKSATKGVQNSKRVDTYQYYLKLDGQRQQVCRVMFLNTLGLKKTQVHDWVKKKTTTRKPRSQESYRRNPIQNVMPLFMKNSIRFISSYHTSRILPFC